VGRGPWTVGVWSIGMLTLAQLLNGEETFGPLAALIRFKTEEEVIVSVARARPCFLPRRPQRPHLS
jgi:acyl-CoA reductase-like NAD-dependent aldehyde dehydrogenase